MAQAQNFPGGGGEEETTPTVNANPPAEQFAMSPGGVDMRTGAYVYRHTDVAIGTASPNKGLSLERIIASTVAGHIKPFGNFSHNWDIMLWEKRVNMFKGDYARGAGQDYRISVVFGARSETFDGRYSASYFDQISKLSRGSLSYVGDRTSTNVIYTFTAYDGTKVKFRPIRLGECSNIDRCAFPSELITPSGAVYTFSYDNGGSSPSTGTRLRRVVSSEGYALIYEYEPEAWNWNYISKVCAINLAIMVAPANNICPTNAVNKASYSYTYANGSRRLASMTDASDAAWNFSYTTSSPRALVHKYFEPGQSVAKVSNSISGGSTPDGVAEERVGYQIFADGRSYSYQYDMTPYVEGQTATIAGGRYQDNLGRITKLEYEFPIRPGSTTNNPNPVTFGYVDYQHTPGPTKVTDPLGRIYKSSYCDRVAETVYPSNEVNRCLVTTLQWSEDPDGNRTEYYIGSTTRDLYKRIRKAKPGSGLPDITEEWGYCDYDVCRGKPTRVQDANGNVTNYTYDPVHGGMLTATLPAAANGIRPQTRYTYAQRYAWIKNSSGGYVRAATPIWVLKQKSSCRTTAALGAGCVGGVADEVKTLYDYGPDSGPNNLLLRGMTVVADGQTLRSCYTYDENGRQTSETPPRANLSACP
ncbi:hypothetical protein [Parasphingorhabdus litoris]